MPSIRTVIVQSEAPFYAIERKNGAALPWQVTVQSYSDETPILAAAFLTKADANAYVLAFDSSAEIFDHLDS